MSISVRDLLNTKKIDVEVAVGGWVRTRRDSKGFSFIELNDGSCLSSIQVLAKDTLSNYQDVLQDLHTGASVFIRGLLVSSPAKGQQVEILATEIKVLGHADAGSYPLQKKRHSNEFLRSISHLRFRTNTFGAVFRLRSELSFAVHKFFHERGFVYLHTPIITTADCEGAGAMFQVTTLNLSSIPNDDRGMPNYAEDFFGRKASLTVSGQLEAEAAACALGKVYTFGPTFRAENSNTPRHLSEFWMIEPEVAFNDLEANMRLAEDFTKFLIEYSLAHCAEDMQFFDSWIEKGIIKALRDVAEAKFEVMTYTEAIAVLERSNKEFQFPTTWGSELQTEHERFLTDEYVKGPCFVIDYPKDIKAFYMRQNQDGKTVRAMDLLVPRLGEIIGGSQREEREDCLRARITEMGFEPADYDWYLDLRRFGTVPHAGFGLGFERLLMYVSGISNIRDVIPFPRFPGHAEF